MIDHIHAEGRKVAALCGSPYQALKHADADVDIIIAQGGEGGGHCGDVGSIVLWPQVVKAVAPTPVLAAGGIGSGEQIAAALGDRLPGRVVGLAVADGRGGREHPPAQQQHLHRRLSRDTVRSRVVHRQALPHAPQRLDRRLGDARATPEPLRHAVAVHGLG